MEGSAEPVPDLVIRPPRHRMALPAVIQKRPTKLPPARVLIGAGVLVLMAVAALAAYFYLQTLP